MDKFTQLVIAEPRNGGVSVDKLISDTPINMDRIVAHYEQEQDFDWERDSITLVDTPEEIDLDASLLDVDNELWNDNKIQFARLLSEIQAAGGFTEELLADLRVSMDLSDAEIFEVVGRADKVFEESKERI